MVRENEVREAEVTIEPPAATDAGFVFIGRIRTPWTSRLVAPRQGRGDGPVCRIEVFQPWIPALQGLEAYSQIEVLYWLHLSRRDLVLRARPTMATPAARSRCDPRLAPIRSAPRLRCFNGLTAAPSTCAASIASTRRRCSTSSLIERCSHRLPRPRPEIFRSVTPEPLMLGLQTRR